MGGKKICSGKEKIEVYFRNSVESCLKLPIWPVPSCGPGCSHLSCSLVTSGVPHGSILRPLLFIISMNSIFDVALNSGYRIVLYADDMVLYSLLNAIKTCLIFRMISMLFFHGLLPIPYP